MKQILSVLLLAGLAATTSCNHSTADGEKVAQQRVIDSMRTEIVRQHTVDSMNELSRMQQSVATDQQLSSKAAATPQKAVVYKRNESAPRHMEPRHKAGHYASSRYAGDHSYVQAPSRRRGWSAKAKGAVIGTGVGAITGAVVNRRNRGVGAIIGGVSGAAVGTGVGAIIDRKHHR